MRLHKIMVNLFKEMAEELPTIVCEQPYKASTSLGVFNGHGVSNTPIMMSLLEERIDGGTFIDSLVKFYDEFFIEKSPYRYYTPSAIFQTNKKEKLQPELIEKLKAEGF